MDKDVTEGDFKLEVWGEAVCVTHAHKPKLQNEGNGVSWITLNGDQKYTENALFVTTI